MKCYHSRNRLIGAPVCFISPQTSKFCDDVTTIDLDGIQHSFSIEACLPKEAFCDAIYPKGLDFGRIDIGVKGITGKILETIYRNPTNGDLIQDPSRLLSTDKLMRNGKISGSDTDPIELMKTDFKVGTEKIVKEVADEAEIAALREELEKVALEDEAEATATVTPAVESGVEKVTEKIEDKISKNQMSPAVDVLRQIADEKEALERFKPIMSLFEAMANLKNQEEALKTHQSNNRVGVSGVFSAVEKILVPGGVVTNTQTTVQTFQPLRNPFENQAPVGVRRLVNSIARDVEPEVDEDDGEVMIGEPAFVLLRAPEPVGVAGVVERFL